MNDRATETFREDPTPSVGEIRPLDPSKLKFFRRGSALMLTEEGHATHLKVSVVRAFPLSEADRHLSVRNGGTDEIGMLDSLSRLSGENRQLVAEELDRRYVLPAVRRILDLRERFETQEWTVETNRGKRTFLTRSIHENIHRPSRDRYIVTDIEGNRYDIPDLAALDAVSRSFLLRYV